MDISSTQTISPFTPTPWGRDFYRDPTSPTSPDIDTVVWSTPAAQEILESAYWAVKVGRGLDDAQTGAGVTLEQFRATLRD